MGEGKAKEGEHRLAFHSPGLGKLGSKVGLGSVEYRMSKAHTHTWFVSLILPSRGSGRQYMSLYF